MASGTQNAEFKLNWKFILVLSGHELHCSLISLISSMLRGTFSAPSGGPRANMNELFGFGEDAYFGVWPSCCCCCDNERSSIATVKLLLVLVPVGDIVCS